MISNGSYSFQSVFIALESFSFFNIWDYIPKLLQCQQKIWPDDPIHAFVLTKLFRSDNGNVVRDEHFALRLPIFLNGYGRAQIAYQPSPSTPKQGAVNLATHRF